MKKNNIKFVLVAFVTSCGFFAVPCLSSYAGANHSENVVTTASCVNGSNQNQEDSIKQSLEEIFQHCLTSPENLYGYTSHELSQLWNEILQIDWVLTYEEGKKGYERFDGVFWDFCSWTGKENCYPYDYVIKEIFVVTDEIGYINVLFKCQDIDDEPVDDVEVTVKMKYEKFQVEWSLEEKYEDKWVVDNVYNLKNMLREYIKSGKKIPADLRYKDIEEMPKPVGKSSDDPCERIMDAYENCTDLCKAARNSNDDKEKKKLFLEAYNINKKLVADPASSECFPNFSFIKDNLEYIERELKELGVEF